MADVSFFIVSYQSIPFSTLLIFRLDLWCGYCYSFCLHILFTNRRITKRLLYSYDQLSVTRKYLQFLGTLALLIHNTKKFDCAKCTQWTNNNMLRFLDLKDAHRNVISCPTHSTSEFLQKIWYSKILHQLSISDTWITAAVCWTSALILRYFHQRRRKHALMRLCFFNIAGQTVYMLTYLSAFARHSAFSVFSRRKCQEMNKQNLTIVAYIVTWCRTRSCVSSEDFSGLVNAICKCRNLLFTGFLLAADWDWKKILMRMCENEWLLMWLQS